MDIKAGRPHVIWYALGCGAVASMMSTPRTGNWLACSLILAVRPRSAGNEIIAVR